VACLIISVSFFRFYLCFALQALNNTSNEVKMLVGNVSEVLARRVFPRTLNRDMYRYMLPALVNGTKEKNSMVRAACEAALVWLLHLRHGENTMNVSKRIGLLVLVS